MLKLVSFSHVTNRPTDPSIICLVYVRAGASLLYVVSMLSAMTMTMTNYLSAARPIHPLSRVRQVPLTGFLVNGEEAPAAELMVANGLDVTKENLLALRCVCALYVCKVK